MRDTDLDVPGTVTCSGCKQTWDTTFRLYWTNPQHCRGRWRDNQRHGNPECSTTGGELVFTTTKGIQL